MSKVALKNVRLSFPDLFEAVQFQGTGPHNYRASFLFDPNGQAHKDINAAIKKVAEEKWGKKAEALLPGIVANPQKTCLSDGNTKDYQGYEGQMVLSASRTKDKGRPVLLNRDKTPITEADGTIYAGCYVNASVELWAQDNAYGKAIRATLLAVQFSKDGDAFSGGSVGNPDDFDDLSVEGDELADLL